METDIMCKKEDNPKTSRHIGSWFSHSIDEKIYVTLLSISLILLFYSIWEMKPIIISSEDFLGLTSHLTLAYWIGFVIIVSSSIRLYVDKGIKNDCIYFAYLIVVGFYLFAVPIFAEDNARFPWSYYPAGEVRTVLDTKKIDITSNYPIMSYRSWPATHIMSASIIYLADVQLENLIKYMPIFWIILFASTVLAIGRRIGLSINKSFLLSLLVISSFWSFHYYYGPQSFGHILYLSLFLVMINLNSHMEGIIITLLTFTVLVQTHMLTSIAFICSTISSSRMLIEKNRIRFIILLLIIFATWYVFIASTMFRMGIEEFVRQATRVEVLSFVNTGKYEQGELLTRQITHYARLSYLGIYAFFMGISVLLYAIGKIKEENKKIFKISLYWIIGTLTLFAFKYGASEIDDRIYILSLVPMALIFISSFNNRILIAIAILFISLHIPAHYGSESFDQALTTELKGAEFFGINVPTNGDRYSYYYAPYIRFYDPKKIAMRWASYTGAIRPNISKLDNVKYIVDSEGTYNFMMYAHGFDPVKKWLGMNEDNHNLYMIYDNGYFRTYRNNIPKTSR